jgi:hypothetical protein
MKAFLNRIFAVDKKIKFWDEIGFKLAAEDGQLITITPLRKTFDHSNGGMMIFFSAETDLKYKPKMSNEEVYFPDEMVTKLNRAFHYYANLISVTEVCRVDISAPSPSMGFIPVSQEEKDFLDKAKRLHDELIAKLVFGGNFLEAVAKDQLLDRAEGLSFVAAANSLTDNVAKLHEFVRLFERAFSVPSNELVKLLFMFLSQNKLFDYTEDEIKSWIIEKRDAATHADKRSSFVFSADLIDDIDRISQAAYDVLFNKTVWHDKSTTRRNILNFKTIHNKRGFALIKDKEGEEKEYIRFDGNIFFRAEINDIDFYSNPPKLPKNWWIRRTSD